MAKLPALSVEVPLPCLGLLLVNQSNANAEDASQVGEHKENQVENHGERRIQLKELLLV